MAAGGAAYNCPLEKSQRQLIISAMPRANKLGDSNEMGFLREVFSCNDCANTSRDGGSPESRIGEQPSASMPGLYRGLSLQNQLRRLPINKAARYDNSQTKQGQLRALVKVLVSSKGESRSERGYLFTSYSSEREQRK